MTKWTLTEAAKKRIAKSFQNKWVAVDSHERPAPKLAALLNEALREEGMSGSFSHTSAVIHHMATDEQTHYNYIVGRLAAETMEDLETIQQLVRDVNGTQDELRRLTAHKESECT